MTQTIAGNYIVKVTPTVDEARLRKTENQYLTRMKRLATRTSNVLGTAFRSLGKGGLIGGAVAALTAFVGTEYQKMSDTLDKILGIGDKIATLTGQLKSDGVDLSDSDVMIGSAIAKTAGVDIDAFIKGLTQFQQSRQTDENLSEFKEGNVLSQFMNLMQSFSRLQGDERTEAMASVFGSKGVVAFQEMAQTDLVGAVKTLTTALAKEGITSATLDKNIAKTGELEGKQAMNREINNIIEFSKQASVITPDMVNQQGAVERQKIEQETETLKRSKDIIKAEEAKQKLMSEAQALITEAQAVLIPTLMGFITEIKFTIDSVKKDGIWGAVKTYFTRYYMGSPTKSVPKR